MNFHPNVLKKNKLCKF